MLEKSFWTSSLLIELIFSYFFKDFTQILSYHFYNILDFQEHVFFKTTLFLTPSQWLA